jgi:molybdate transport system substrate-binding protein
MVIVVLLIACGGATTNRSPAGESAATSATTLGSGEIPAMSGTLTVFAAASLSDAFNEIGKNIEAVNPRAEVNFSFAGSSTLRTQLLQGAPADVFASANQENMQQAKEGGVIPGEPRTFVHNRLVVIVPAANPAGIMTLQDLAKPGIKLVLAQQDVPVGTYARQSLDKLSQDPAYGTHLSSRVLTNLASEEANVKAVVTKVQLGEADAGIVYSSDVTPDVRDAVEVIEIPDQVNVTADYPMAVVEDAANPSGAQAFIDYVLSPDGQEILKTHGFIPVSGM